jgi:hypothetical protein
MLGQGNDYLAVQGTIDPAAPVEQTRQRHRVGQLDHAGLASTGRPPAS